MGEMRSAARYARKLDGASFREPRAGPSCTEARFATCHCHCPSGRDEDAVASAMTCVLCERLCGGDPPPNAIRTEDGLAAGCRYDRSRRESSGSSSSANDSGAIDRKRDRTFWCDRVSFSGSSARCASNVVRWNITGKLEGKRSTTWSGFLSIFLILAVSGLAAAQRRGFGPSTAIGPSNKDGVCQSIDIRNSVDQFSRLEGCRVVEGFVQILLIDRAEQSAYANISFPDLVEITDYLILYRVSGLRSIGHLFPNLTVIRGHTLFINYALVAFEMMHLQEIGLHSLTNILRGSVRFEKNPTLCYVDTVDWDIIARAGKGEHVISGNKLVNGCPVCDKSCPVRQTKPDETLCWNRQHCQRLCDRKCGDGTCDDTGRCCHPFCLGGCTGPTAKDCIVCKDVTVEGNECKDRCPNDMYKFMNRRCIQEKECRQMWKPREALDTIKQHPYKPFNGSCVIECPAGYMDDDINESCKKCEGVCLKECAGTNVDSIASAQKLRGCTYIKGSLEIQIRGGKNIVKELEESLSMIEVIDGYLKIVRSFPLISLNFLKSLRKIRGKYLDNGKYTLAVFDNQNLQELWDWSTHPGIEILNNDDPKIAKIFFHFNPKLCLSKIETLREKAKLNEFTDLDVAPNSNGDKVACNVTELKTKVLKKTSRGAIIEWEAFTHHDTRSLLGYVVYFIEAPNKNVTMYDGRDACGGDGWRVEDVSAENPTPQSYNGTEIQGPIYLNHILTLLKPYTQYAYYVKTYTIATERSGAQSKVKYFMTFPDAPSSPRALSTWSNSSSELVMSWFPPLHENGNLTHYRIIGRWEPDDPNFIDQRNYCDEPMLLPEKKPMAVIAEEERKRAEEEKELAKLPQTTSCDCADRETDQSMREKEVSSSIAFENALHNQVYVKRMNTRRRRHTSEMLIAAELAKDSYSDQNKEKNNDKIENGTYTMFERLVPSTNLTYVMRNLRHFAAYNIEVQACRERIIDESKKNCSTKSMKTYRTLAMESADNIPLNTFKLSVSHENNSFSIVTLYWDEPLQPNGLIVTYQIEYKRIDIKNIKPTVVCITRRDFTNAGNSYLLKDLPAGNYTVKVRATSLAGNGAYTEVKYFYINEHGIYSTVWIVIVIICLIIFIVSAIYFIYRRKKRDESGRKLFATVNPEYVSTVYVPDEWEVQRKKIRLLRELGNGSFGMVYEGVAKDVVKGKSEVRCAVKTVNEHATDRQRIEFLNEASVMKAFNTHHVIKLLGVVSQGQPTLVVMELMVSGDLKTYLRRHRPDVCENISKLPPTLDRILKMAVEISDGMAYLAAKKFVHRDLAARNCMVAEDLTVKIGDFGMTRDIYETDYYRKGTKGLLPVRWMAPESLKDGVFTSFSDVWSYGVVLWEMVTLASQPYQGLSNDQVLRYVIEGGVMERPENCPDSFYNLMRRTWTHKATRRPTFIDIATILLQEINDVEDFERVSFYHSPEGIDARNQNNSHSPQNDKDLEMAALQDLREEEIEEEEDSPLRQDFCDFADFEPTSIKKNLSPRYGDSYGKSFEVISDFHDMNSTKVPLKARFDDFDGVSGDSQDSSKDTLNLPFVEDSLKSVKNSLFIPKKSTSRSNISQASLGKSGSPSSIMNRNFLDSPNPVSKLRSNPDYENRSPEIMSAMEKKEITPHIDFQSMDAIDIIMNSGRNESRNMGEYVNKTEPLNNGYIDNSTT